MISELQLTLPFDEKDPVDLRLHQMQEQIDLMNQSMGKVRKRLFFELCEIKKRCDTLIHENQELKQQLQTLKDQKTEWIYGTSDYLFELKAISQ